MAAKKRPEKTNRKKVYIVSAMAAAIIAAIILLMFAKGYGVNIEGIKVSTHKAIDIANANPEVNGYLAGRQFTVTAGNVTGDDRSKMPSIYRDIGNAVYKVVYSMNDMDLLVITDDEKVLKVVPVSRIRISGSVENL